MIWGAEELRQGFAGSTAKGVSRASVEVLARAGALPEGPAGKYQLPSSCGNEGETVIQFLVGCGLRAQLLTGSLSLPSVLCLGDLSTVQSTARQLAAEPEGGSLLVGRMLQFQVMLIIEAISLCFCHSLTEPSHKLSLHTREEISQGHEYQEAGPSGTDLESAKLSEQMRKTA